MTNDIPHIVIMSNGITEALYVNGKLEEAVEGCFLCPGYLITSFVPEEEWYEGTNPDVGEWPKTLDELSYW